MEGDATVATGGDGNGEGDELTRFFAEERGFGIGGGEGLVALEGVWGEFGEAGDGFGEFGLIGVPIEKHCVNLLVGFGRGVEVYNGGGDFERWGTKRGKKRFHRRVSRGPQRKRRGWVVRTNFGETGRCDRVFDSRMNGGLDRSEKRVCGVGS